MQLSDLPARIRAAFAVSGAKRTIPVASQIGVTAGAASYTDGFPPLTMQALNAGGVPPAGQDFNGVFFDITSIQRWQAAGGSFTYDAAWSTANNGYPKGACLLRADGSGFWFNTAENNTADPDGATPTGWVPEWQYGIAAVTGLTNANVTLTSLQYGRPILTFAGTLTGNVQIILPAIAAQQWLTVNNTTGAFSLTVKTAAGSGQIVPQGQTLAIWGDGTNINSAGQPGRFLRRRVFTSTQIYTPSAGVTAVNVLVQGGGGGGGSGAGTAAGQCAAGSGGGAGGWARKFLISGFSGVTITVGTAGGGAVPNNPGGSGGTTSFGALVSATGGTGGSFGPALANGTTQPQGAANGGLGSLGDENSVGGYGGYALYGPTPISGGGGTSYFGSGAGGVTNYATGLTATAYGAGGSGGNVTPSNAGGASSGGGGAGICIVDEFS